MKTLLVAALAVIVLAVPALATQNVVYPFGRVDVTVPVNQYINIAAGGASVKVWKQSGGPSSNRPVTWTPETTVTGGILTNREVTFGPYTVAQVIRIETGADPAFYSVGALAASLPVLRIQPRVSYTQLAPVTYNSTGTLLASDMMAGILTSTQATGATITLTLPTGTLMDTASGLGIDTGFEWSLINLSGTPGTNSVTLGAGSGHTIVGEAVTGSSTTGTNSSRWFTRKTAANTFVTYRLH